MEALDAGVFERGGGRRRFDNARARKTFVNANDFETKPSIGSF